MQLNILNNDFYNLKFISLLGNPVSHSLSPMMQNAAYKFLNLNFIYTLCECSGDSLKHIVNGIKHMPNYIGFALTTPNKIEVMQYLDEHDDLCLKLGSANTVVKLENKLIGYNTDGYGAVRSLKEFCDVSGKIIFAFGAGGAGRSVCFELANNNAKKIYICSRSSSCETLSNNINKYFNNKCVPVNAADKANVKNFIAEADIILNLSGAGMAGREAETCVDANFLNAEQICFDAAYSPLKTRFLIEAEARGCKIINGLNMLLYQGVRQLELWTGISDINIINEAVEIMRSELVKNLNHD